MDDQQEILALRVVGMTRSAAINYPQDVREWDDEVAWVIPEPSNPYDRNAMAVFQLRLDGQQKARQVGYLKASAAQKLSNRVPREGVPAYLSCVQHPEHPDQPGAEINVVLPKAA